LQLEKPKTDYTDFSK